MKIFKYSKNFFYKKLYFAFASNNKNSKSKISKELTLDTVTELIKTKKSKKKSSVIEDNPDQKINENSNSKLNNLKVVNNPINMKIEELIQNEIIKIKPKSKKKFEIPKDEDGDDKIKEIKISKKILHIESETYSIHKSLVKNNNSSLNINTVQEDDKHILYFLDIKITIPKMIIKHIQEKINLLTTKHIDIFIDGGCSGANKIGVIGVTVYIADISIFKLSGNIGPWCTNNTAEYMALIYSAFILNLLNINKHKIFFKTDSELMCRQINKEYKVSTSHIIVLFNIAQHLLKNLHNMTINHVYREYNTEADSLANMAKNKGYKKIYLYY